MCNGINEILSLMKLTEEIGSFNKGCYQNDNFARVRDLGTWIQLPSATPSLPAQNREQRGLYGIFNEILISGYFTNSQ